MNHQKSVGHSAMLIVNIFFGINMAVSKDLLGGAISPMDLNALRFIFGAIGFWLISIFYKERVTKKDLGILFLASLLGLIGNQVLFVQGLSRTSPIDASIITTSVPILTMLFSAMILKEPITWLKALGVLVGASGAIFLIYSSQNGSSGTSNILGDLLCFGSCVSFAFFLVLTKPITQKYSPITMMKWMFLFAVIVFIPFSFSDIRSINFSSFTNKNEASLVFVLIGATLIPYLLIPIGQKRLRPTTVSMYNYVQPIVATFLAVMAGQDKFTVTKAVAAVLVFSGVYIVTRSKSRADLEAEMEAKQSINQAKDTKS
ncbi:MAG: DMT family transporter [Bacteroidales bacterium]|nr:DMT family transporter [Bacteroidales bacterium]